MANDTEAALGVGGLVFQTSKNVEMLSEDLFVSSEQIVVDYRFRNSGKADTTSLIAFPLPELKFDPEESGVESGDDLNFSTFIDNVPVRMDVERKAMLRGRDETATLQRHSVPLNPFAAHEALKADQTLVSKLQELSLVDDDGSPTWGMTTTYFWKQSFPQGKEIRIEHRYRPIVGGSVMTGLGMQFDNRAFYDRYCVDKEFLRAASSAAKGQSVSESFTEHNIEYILTTGANWLGPIRKFRLVVDKGHEDNLVSFCGEGVRKMSPTQFEMTASNFTPRRDLAVLILRPHEREVSNESPGADHTKLSCEELWYKRNSVFKAAGYCFKGSKAISAFGNAGCRYDSPDLVPLGDSDRKWVDSIKAIEQAKRCQH